MAHSRTVHPPPRCAADLAYRVWRSSLTPSLAALAAQVKAVSFGNAFILGSSHCARHAHCAYSVPADASTAAYVLHLAVRNVIGFGVLALFARLTSTLSAQVGRIGESACMHATHTHSSTSLVAGPHHRSSVRRWRGAGRPCCCATRRRTRSPA